MKWAQTKISIQILKKKMIRNRNVPEQIYDQNCTILSQLKLQNHLSFDNTDLAGASPSQLAKKVLHAVEA